MSSIGTVYVVNWDVPPMGVGGFEWRPLRADAEAFRRELSLSDPTAMIYTVKVPDEIAQRGEVMEITEWLDDEGWSEGGDPRRQS
jgi:hypothetical protein